MTCAASIAASVFDKTCATIKKRKKSFSAGGAAATQGGDKYSKCVSLVFARGQHYGTERAIR